MVEGINVFFSKMVGTLAVILVVAAFIGGSDMLLKFIDEKRNRKYSLIAGALGGVFGVYGNISGVNLNGAVISVRDIGPMLAGFTGGPIGGLIAGAIAGIHRLAMGGITAQACVVATCSIGLICGFISYKYRDIIEKPVWAFVIGTVMEAFHLSIVLVMVKPFETALDIVRQIAIPFISVNAIGFTMMILIITYTEKQRKLTLEKSRLQSELEVANVIQNSLLPVINSSYPGREEIDVSGFMEAAKEVGGDFYDVFFVDNNRIAFVIGDVSGKGVPAALFMASSKIILQNCVRDIPDLSDAVETANHVLCERNEADMFVTAWVGVLNLTTFEVEYVCAGHNPPAYISEGKADYIKTKSGFVLAGMDGVKYKKHTMQLDHGDTVLLYTDGIVEAETKQHELFGEDRLLDSLKDAEENSAATITETVKTSVNGFVNGNSQFDDMTLLCFKIN
ncbi:MAG: SpoIIE family protein phosphatase [Clostridia bacterium]|nr:SpoIIE family protein phosphatase [Clostridia bacterium]